MASRGTGGWGEGGGRRGGRRGWDGVYQSKLELTVTLVIESPKSPLPIKTDWRPTRNKRGHASMKEILYIGREYGARGTRISWNARS